MRGFTHSNLVNFICRDAIYSRDAIYRVSTFPCVPSDNRPVILFLHGFMGNSHEFAGAISRLSHYFFCLTIDLPGHGNNLDLGDEDYTMQNTAQGIVNLLNQENISECILVGYSMGGRLALYLALHFPERFSQLILESASPGLATEVERLERVQRDNQIARKLDRITTKEEFNNFLSAWYSQPIFGNIKNHPQFDQLIATRLQNHPKELAKSLRFMGTGSQPSLWNKLKHHQHPILLLVGESDTKFVEINTNMANVCSYCDLKIIPNTGHNIHFENTQAFVKLGFFF